VLPPINLLNPEQIELTSDTQAGSAYDLDDVENQASFGDVMISTGPDAQTQLVTVAGETLPPGGNSLPVDDPMLNIPVDPMSSDEITTIAGEQADAGDVVVLAAPADDDTIDAEPAFPGSVDGGPRRLIEDLHSSGRMRNGIQSPLSPRNIPVFNGQSANVISENPTKHDVKASSPVDLPVGLATSEGNDIARPMAGSAPMNLRPLAEKIEITQRRTDIAGSLPTVAATENLAMGAGTVQVTRNPPASALQASIDIPVLDDAWNDAINERVLWLAGKSIKKAEIRLNPADMAQIRVEVTVADDAAKVSFSAHNALTRDAIESAIPRLREMLSENGLSLANTDVSDAGVQHEQHTSEHDALHGPSVDSDGLLEEGEIISTSTSASRSMSALVDTFV